MHDEERRTISLDPFKFLHIKKTFGWIQDASLRQDFLMRGEVTWEGHTEYYRKVLDDKTQRVYAIYYSGKHVGNCGYKNINVAEREAELWIYIGEKRFRGLGIGRIASKKLLKIGFETLGIEKVYLHVAKFNVSAISLYSRLSFEQVNVEDFPTEWLDRSECVIRMEKQKTVEN